MDNITRTYRVADGEMNCIAEAHVSALESDMFQAHSIWLSSQVLCRCEMQLLLLFSVFLLLQSVLGVRVTAFFVRGNYLYSRYSTM